MILVGAVDCLEHLLVGGDPVDAPEAYLRSQGIDVAADPAIAGVASVPTTPTSSRARFILPAVTN